MTRKEIEELFKSEDYDNAVIEIKKALKDDPNNGELIYYLFLAENKDYANIDLANIIDEASFNKALDISNRRLRNEFEAEYNFYRDSDINFRKLFCYASRENKDKLLELFDDVNSAKLPDNIDDYIDNLDYVVTSRFSKNSEELNIIVLNLLFIFTKEERIINIINVLLNRIIEKDIKFKEYIIFDNKKDIISFIESNDEEDIELEEMVDDDEDNNDFIIMNGSPEPSRLVRIIEENPDGTFSSKLVVADDEDDDYDEDEDEEDGDVVFSLPGEDAYTNLVVKHLDGTYSLKPMPNPIVESLAPNTYILEESETEDSVNYKFVTEPPLPKLKEVKIKESDGTISTILVEDDEERKRKDELEEKRKEIISRIVEGEKTEYKSKKIDKFLRTGIDKKIVNFMLKLFMFLIVGTCFAGIGYVGARIIRLEGYNWPKWLFDLATGSPRNPIFEFVLLFYLRLFVLLLGSGLGYALMYGVIPIIAVGIIFYIAMCIVSIYRDGFRYRHDWFDLDRYWEHYIIIIMALAALSIIWGGYW